jgi:hypothetical protein
MEGERGCWGSYTRTTLTTYERRIPLLDTPDVRLRLTEEEVVLGTVLVIRTQDVQYEAPQIVQCEEATNAANSAHSAKCKVWVYPVSPGQSSSTSPSS